MRKNILVTNFITILDRHLLLPQVVWWLTCRQGGDLLVGNRSKNKKSDYDDVTAPSPRFFLSLARRTWEVIYIGYNERYYLEIKSAISSRSTSVFVRGSSLCKARSKIRVALSSWRELRPWTDFNGCVSSLSYIWAALITAWIPQSTTFRCLAV